MKKKLIIIIICIIPVIFILTSILSFEKDKSDSKKAMKMVDEHYKNFEDDASNFSAMRDYIYENIFGSGYAENFKKNYESYYKYFDEYGNVVSKMKSDSKELDKLCSGIYYTSKSVNSKCTVFVDNYELINNYYVLDVKRFNVLIDEYNKYIDEGNIKSNKLSAYKAKYKYVDYNKDKKYAGKE